MNTTALRWLALAALVFPGVTAFAQKKPKENAEVLVSVKWAEYDVPTSATYSFSFEDTGSSGPAMISESGNGSGNGVYTSTAASAKLLQPGRLYKATLSASSWSYGELKLSAPAGYVVYIDDRATSTARVTSSPGTISHIEIRPLDDSSILPAGAALAPRVGDIIWSISAGRYANGRSAGAIQWRSSTFSSALLAPLSLDYAEPSSTEITVHKHSDGALMEIRSPQMLFYVRRGSPGAGYTIEIYSPDAGMTSDHGDATDGPFDYDQSPLLEYHITNPNGTTWNNEILIEKVVRNADTSTKSTTWDVTKSGSDWSVVETDNVKITELTSTTSSGVRTETIVVRDDATTPNVATKLVRKYDETLPWNQEEMTQEIADPDGLALTTDFTYGTTSSSSAYGRLATVTRPDGSWESYVYDDTLAGWGNLSAVYRPWQDGPSGGVTYATATNSAATFYDYAAERAPFLDLSAGSHTKIANVDVGQTAVSYAFPGNAPNGEPLRTETVNTYTASGTYLTTTRQIYHRTASPDFAGRLYSQVNPDGTKVSALRYKGVWSQPNTWGEYRFSGYSTAVTDGTTTAVAVNSFDGQSFDTVYMVPNRSTIEMDVYNSEDRVEYHESYVFTGASSGVPTFEELDRDYFVYLFGQLHFHSDMYGLREINWLSDGAPSGKHANDGTYEQYQTDSSGRYTGTIKWYEPADTGYAAQDHLYTNWTRDAANRILTEQVSSEGPGTDPNDAVTNAYIYNKAGLVTSQSAETSGGNFTTTIGYTNGGRTVTQTIPGGFTLVTDHYLDGSVKSITGTGTVAEYHAATVNSGGTITQEVHAATSTDVRWKKVTTDWAGRTIKEESPAYSSGTFTRQYYYNSVGQLIKTTETDLADALIEYNAWQQPYRKGLNVDGTGGLSIASGGTDRVADTDVIFEKSGGNWWLKTTTKTYNDSGTAITTGVTKQRLTGYSYGNNPGTDANIASETVSTDVFGNSTTHTIDIHRGSGSGPTGDWDVRLVTDKVIYPDSSTAQVAIVRNGLLQQTTSKEGLVSRYYYDVRRRLISQTDHRIDGGSYLTSPPVRIGYVTHSDRVAWQKDTAGKQTSFTYDGTTARLAATTDPLGKLAYQSYNDRGQVVRSWGDTTYPVEYGYDSYGEQTTMSTFRGGSGWTGSSWPGSPGTADTTTWAYEAATGLLTSKTDAASRHVDYTYNNRGQLATRTWSRGVSATYSYDSATAEQTGINYSDSTPDLTYTYNRLGQTATVADVAGTRTFAYDGSTSVLNTETYPSYFESRVMTRKYDTTGTGHLPGRNTGYTLSGASGSGTDNEVSYGYDTKGRFDAVATPSSGPAFTYAFAPNSNLVGSISETSGWTETNTFEADRNLLSRIAGQFSTSVKAQFDYTHDDLGRRLTATDSGEIFARYNGGAITTHYGYNDRSEVTSAQSYYGTDANDTTYPVAARGWDYAFDNIGNRTSSSVIGNGGGDTHTTSYTVNALNQVTTRAGPGSVEATGLAPAGSTVTVNSSATTRQGEYYYQNVTASSPPAWQSAAIASSSPSASETRHSFIPGASETHTYDDDGNLTADGRWSYTWDAENRLVSMETVSGAYSVGVPRQFIQFKYDYLGRRIRKTVASWNSMTSVYDATLDRKFLYNGWNLIAEYDVGTSSLSLVTSYTWGLDLSGNLVDGGGVGGLLAIKQVSGSVWHLPYYDANGNVHALVDRSTGNVTAAYEYSPFGETLRANGAYAASNPFRFSTKYADMETRLLYYGFRYYDPSMGRWLGRDPLGESGGLHLYGFCRNNAVNAYDALGLYTFNEIYGGVPDDDVIRQVHPTWNRIDEGYIHGWINPDKPDEVISFVDGEDPATIDYNDSERFAAPQDNAGTINPSLMQQIDSTFAWSSSFTEEVYIAQVNAAIDAAIDQFLNSIGTGAGKQAPADNSGEPTTGNGAAGSADSNAPNSGDFNVSGKPSQFGTGTLLTPGAVPALDAALKNDNFVNQLGVLYGLNKNYGVQDTVGGKDVTEFFATLNGGSATSKTLYAGPTLSLSTMDFNNGGWTASVTPQVTFSGDLLGVAHTHPINGVPSDGHDFSFQSPVLSSHGTWSVVVTPTTIYFTGPQQGQYYYLPTSAFISAGQANNKTVTIPAQPPRGP